MQDHRAEPLKLYDALKVYLMLGGQGPMDPKAVKAWVTDDWANEALPGSDRAQVREELGKHLDALLGRQAVRSRLAATGRAPRRVADRGRARIGPDPGAGGPSLRHPAPEGGRLRRTGLARRGGAGRRRPARPSSTATR